MSRTSWSGVRSESAPPGLGASLSGSQRDAYLDRIGDRGHLVQDGETLAALSLAHLRAVPFENLDVFGQVPVRLDLDRIYRKVVERHRGGFCYELNALFAALLESLGFEVSLLAMRFAVEGGYGPEHDHLSLAVWPGANGATPDRDVGPWLADVGAGRHSLARPVRLDDVADQAHPADGATHRVVAGMAPCWHLWRRDAGDEWRELYRFTREPQSWDAFAARCAFYQDDPDSDFRQTAWATRLTSDGRITLRDGLLSITHTATGAREEIAIAPADVAATLADHFGITLDRPVHTVPSARPTGVTHDAPGDHEPTTDG